ncbi:MAG: SAM-dependent methyltransferase [Deltaproteobacteria bacterium]|nr:SAM-dependent methyltransferase [Deltaproteobacteria bacterium]
MITEDKNPGPLLAVSGSYWQACALHSGVVTGIFTAMAGKPATADEISRRINTDARATAMLLNALAAMGLTSKKGKIYKNAGLSADFLVKDSPRYVGHMIMHHHFLVQSWSRLHESVKTGEPVRKQPQYEDETQRKSFLLGMFNLASEIAPRLASELDLKGKKHLLDLGGGPGTYAIYFCMANPGLSATIYDLEGTRPYAMRTIEKFNMTGRIGFVAGNYLEDGINGPYDTAWLSHILHGEGPDACVKILKKVAGALDPGGVIFIHDFILDDSGDAPLFPALFSLNMLLGTPDGQAYTETQIKEMLHKAGFSDAYRLSFTGPNDSAIIRARV